MPEHKKTNPQVEKIISVDIESAGRTEQGPIIAIGVAVRTFHSFKETAEWRKHDDYTTAFFGHCPKRPSLDDSGAVKSYGDFNPNCWDTFWSKHQKNLEDLYSKANCIDEAEVITKAVQYIHGVCETTPKKVNVRILSDCPAFDIGCINGRLYFNLRWKNNSEINKVHNLMYQPKSGEEEPEFTNPLCLETYKWAMADMMGAPRSITYKDLAELKHILPKSVPPCEHTHDPENDAALILYNYWLLRHAMAQ